MRAKSRSGRGARIGREAGSLSLVGWVYSRLAGEPDRHLFIGESMNIRQSVSMTDTKRGTGYRMVSREVMLYTFLCSAASDRLHGAKIGRDD
jgi:hypothetical protein